MGKTIIVKNESRLTNSSALERVAWYMAGFTASATKGSIAIEEKATDAKVRIFVVSDVRR